MNTLARVYGNYECKLNKKFYDYQTQQMLQIKLQILI